MIDMIDMEIAESTPGWKSIVNAGGIDVIDDYPTTYIYIYIGDWWFTIYNCGLFFPHIYALGLIIKPVCTLRLMVNPIHTSL